MSDQGRVLVIGNCTLDASFRLPRFPKPGETLLTDEQSQDVGGKGANQAVAAARCGVTVSFCSVVGSDESGRLIRYRLCDEGIDVERVRQVNEPTDQSIIYVTPGGENSIVSTHAAANTMTTSDVDRSLMGAANNDVVLMQGNLAQGLTGYALERARAGGITTIFNPAPIQYPFDELWAFVDHAILNVVEMEHLTGCVDPEAGARSLLDRGVGYVTITLGPGGAISASRAGVEVAPAEQVDAVDTTGAGDVFCGVFASALAMRYPVVKATRLAVRAATMAVTRRGTQSAFPTSTEIGRLMEWAP